MAIVQSRGTLRSVERAPGVPAAAVPTASVFDDRSNATYAAIFRSQPNVRTVVSFLARNVADLNLHVFRRVSDIDRERLADHELAVWMAAPNPAMTHYRMVENLMSDMGVYFNAFWLKLRGEARLHFVRIPPEQMRVEGWLLPSAFYWTLPDNTVMPLATSEVVHFNGYDPCNPLEGLSPIETLRQLLAADAAATLYQRSYYANSSRVEGVIQRPPTAPKWSPEQKQAFREQLQTRFTGQPGQMLVLEDGMTFQSASYSARESEFNLARKLTREEVARAYHVPLPMVGILDNATFSNIREQHKNLYQDCLGPWLTMLQEELERQVLIECDDQRGVYAEFNIDQKLRGSFEEQAGALQTLVGRPVLTLNEGRGRLNLPSIKDDPSANRVAQPLNMSTQAGGATTPTEPVATRAIAASLTAPIIRASWSRQQARLDKVPAEDRAGCFDRLRWDRELAADLTPVYRRAGAPPDLASRLSEAVAVTVNADTHALLLNGVEAFAAHREAALYG